MRFKASGLVIMPHRTVTLRETAHSHHHKTFRIQWPSLSQTYWFWANIQIAVTKDCKKIICKSYNITKKTVLNILICNYYALDNVIFPTTNKIVCFVPDFPREWEPCLRLNVDSQYELEWLLIEWLTVTSTALGQLQLWSIQWQADALSWMRSSVCWRSSSGIKRCPAGTSALDSRTRRSSSSRCHCFFLSTRLYTHTHIHTCRHGIKLEQC